MIVQEGRLNGTYVSVSEMMAWVMIFVEHTGRDCSSFRLSGEGEVGGVGNWDFPSDVVDLPCSKVRLATAVKSSSCFSPGAPSEDKTLVICANTLTW